MHMKFRAATALVLVVILLFLCGCQIMVSTDNGIQAYRSALDRLKGLDFSVVLTINRISQNDSVILEESIVSNITYNSFQTGNMLSSSQTEIRIGDQIMYVNESADANTLFLDINNGKFTTPFTQAEHYEHFFPCGVADPELYDLVEAKKANHILQITFSQANASEHRVIPSNAQLLESTATATISKEGELTEAVSTAKYLDGTTTVTISAACEFDYENAETITMPEDNDSYTEITDYKAAVQLELACAKLLSVQKVEAESSYEMLCEAGGLQRLQVTKTTVSNEDSDYSAKVDTQVKLVNKSLQGAVSEFTQSESFADGKYQLHGDGTAGAGTHSISKDEMRTYCNNNLVSSLLLPQHIQSAARTETDGTIILDFIGTQELAELLFFHAYQTLYTDLAASESLIHSYDTQEVTGHVEISKQTGLPIRSGLHYSGVSQIDQSQYAFTVTIEQNYSYA